MKNIVKFLCVIFFCIVILYGCGKKHTHPVYNAVTQVDIVTKHRHQLIRIRYNTPEKMRPVLLYLRLLKPEGKPVQLDENTEDMYLICIFLSDGTKRYYRQANHRYISKEKGPWKAIDPKYASNLYSILQELPADI